MGGQLGVIVDGKIRQSRFRWKTTVGDGDSVHASAAGSAEAGERILEDQTLIGTQG